MKEDHLAENLRLLRQANRWSLEETAEKLGVSRQAVSKWESGESAPDLSNAQSLAELYGVTLDDLVGFDPAGGVTVPPKGKYIFGMVTVGERGQIVIPKKARDIFHIKPGDALLLLGNEGPENRGLALMDMTFQNAVLDLMKGRDRDGSDPNHGPDETVS